MRPGGYLPISQYGVIGDCRSAALVGADGSIDWLCLPRFDSPSLLGRVLDCDRGGFWQICPTGEFAARQRYLDRTNVLSTIFTTGSGRMVVTDFMPADASSIGQHASPHAHPRIVRIVECLSGSVTACSVFDPRPDYGSGTLRLHTSSGRWHGDDGRLHYCLQTTSGAVGARMELQLSPGEAVAFGLVTDNAGSCTSLPWTLEAARELLHSTDRFWREWLDSCSYRGVFREPVWRSALALKLMTYAPTGAIVAAPTTSLPEKVGGTRNWDYRYTWLRDASFTLYAFFQLGFHDEAHAFFRWLQSTGIGSLGIGVSNLYTLDGSGDVPETELTHLAGYRGSKPVRIGNLAADQLQLDVYGEILDAAYVYAKYGGEVDGALWSQLEAIVELAAARWSEPDASIWEPRGGDQHFTYSRFMCWVALDRGLRLAEQWGHPHDSGRWRAIRRQIHLSVTEHAFSQQQQSFTQALGSELLDAAVLRMHQVGFLPPHDPRLRSTSRAIAAQLGTGALLRRYDPAKRLDGIHESEGAFVLCSFWLVDALAHQGDIEEAERLFNQLLAFASPLGLYAEECDMGTGELLGNFPQAFSHLALVGAAVNIERARVGSLKHQDGPAQSV